ncbi:hypothetical protein B0J17DRAFT_646136 [Rhizoctonia solani]|nr:hypothetical protein B0J17DRAFT_646136 [Rhizoctonia solani]
MAGAFAKQAGMRVFEQHMQNYTPSDPYTRKKRRKRELPPGLSKRDAAILKKVKKRAHYLDKGFSICGITHCLIGIIPGAGDVVDAALNYFLVVRKARQAEIPPWLLRKMLANNVVSAGVGLIPLVGDIVLAVYKANSRNSALLEEFLRVRGEEFLKTEAARQEDPAVIKPGAGREQGETIPGKNSGFKGLFSGQPKKGNSSTALINQDDARR